MKKVCCPHCLGSGKIELQVPLPVYLPPMGARIYQLIKSAPGRIDGPRLVDLIYADRHDGGPDNPLNVIYVTIKHTNRRLAPAGEQIKATNRGPGGTYRIVKTDVV